jgi:hypothetical protein
MLVEKPEVKFVVVVDDTYEPGVHGFATRESAEEFYDRTNGTGEEVLLLEVLKQK